MINDIVIIVEYTFFFNILNNYTLNISKNGITYLLFAKLLQFNFINTLKILIKNNLIVKLYLFKKPSL